MANIATTRIKREFREICSEYSEIDGNPDSIKVELIDDGNYTKLRGKINGPPDTPYQGGRYILEINIPDTYPFQPPKVQFVTKIWHPNISSVTGAICLDVLKDQWAAAMTLRTVLLSIQTLLAHPEPDDPQDAVVASQYKEHFHIYQKTARHWANLYANSNSVESDCREKISQLQQMGIDEHQASVVLSSNNWNLEVAVEQLFN